MMVEEPLHLDQEEFDQLVSGVMDELPAEWAPLVDSMAVVVEDEPAEEDVPARAAREGEPLGRYRGTSGPVQLIGGGLTGPAVTAPPEIALFQGPLERASSDLDDLRRHVYDTLVEQIGHHFGYTDELVDDEDDDDELDVDDLDADDTKATDPDADARGRGADSAADERQR